MICYFDLRGGRCDSYSSTRACSVRIESGGFTLSDL